MAHEYDDDKLLDTIEDVCKDTLANYISNVTDSH